MNQLQDLFDTLSKFSHSNLEIQDALLAGLVLGSIHGTSSVLEQVLADILNCVEDGDPQSYLKQRVRVYNRYRS